MGIFLVSGTHDLTLCPRPARPPGGRKQQQGTASLAHRTLHWVARSPFQGGPQGPLTTGHTLCLGLCHSKARPVLTHLTSCGWAWDAS